MFEHNRTSICTAVSGVGTCLWWPVERLMENMCGVEKKSKEKKKEKKKKKKSVRKTNKTICTANYFLNIKIFN